MSDRIGRKPILIAGLHAISLSYVMLAYGEAVLQMGMAPLFGALLAGNVEGAFAAADLPDEKTRARYMGLLGAAAGFGLIVGSALGAALVGSNPDADFRRICEVAAVFAEGKLNSNHQPAIEIDAKRPT